jgi:hypothetical protein
MGRRARHVLTAAEDIARIEHLATRMPSGTRVRITLRNGDVFTGLVAEIPNVQVFEDDAGREGINAVVRLEEPNVPPWTVYLWLDEIDTVETIDAG